MRERAIQDNWKRETDQFLLLRKQLANASNADSSPLASQLSQHRVNLLNTYTNGLIVSYQKSDFVISQLEKALPRLRTIYEKKSKNVNAPQDFDTRFQNIESRVIAMQEFHTKFNSKLKSLAQQQISRRETIESLYNELDSRLRELQLTLSEYRSLSRQVIAS